MGNMGLDLLIPVHCPLVTECHSPPLPRGCQGNQANTTAAGSPKPSPRCTEPAGLQQEGEGRLPTAQEGGSERGRADTPCFFSISLSKESPHFSHSSPGRKELGRPSCGKAAHSSLGLEKEGPLHLGGRQCLLPLRAGVCPSPYHQSSSRSSPQHLETELGRD